MPNFEFLGNAMQRLYEGGACWRRFRMSSAELKWFFMLSLQHLEANIQYNFYFIEFHEMQGGSYLVHDKYRWQYCPGLIGTY